jgi:hypothetical protein
MTYIADSITTAPVAAYSLRQVRAAYSGPLVNIRRGSDNATEDVYPTASGDFPIAAVTTWAAGATVYVTEWYDQSGNGNHVTQATTGRQPTINLSAYNNLPGLVFLPSNITNLGASFSWFTGAGSWTAVFVEQALTVASNANVLISYGQSGASINISNTGSNGVNGFSDWYSSGSANNLRTGVNATAPVLMAAYANGSNLYMNINNTVYTSGALSSPSISGEQLYFGWGNDSSAARADATIPEILLYSTALASTDLGTLYSNQNSYWILPPAWGAGASSFQPITESGWTGGRESTSFQPITEGGWTGGRESTSFQPVIETASMGTYGAASFQPMTETASSIRGLASLNFQPITGAARAGSQAAASLQPLSEAATSSMPFWGEAVLELIIAEGISGSREAGQFSPIILSGHLLAGEAFFGAIEFPPISETGRTGLRQVGIAGRISAQGHMLCGDNFIYSEIMPALTSYAHMLVGALWEGEADFQAIECEADMWCPWDGQEDGSLGAIGAESSMSTRNRFRGYIVQFQQYDSGQSS